MNSYNYKLLSCPFCGGEAKIKLGFSPAMGAADKTACVQCIKCGCQTKTEIEWGNNYIEIVVNLWNTRCQ